MGYVPTQTGKKMTPTKSKVAAGGPNSKKGITPKSNQAGSLKNVASSIQPMPKAKRK